MFQFWGDNWQLRNLRIEDYHGGQGILFGGDNILMENVSVTTPDENPGTGAFRMVGGTGFRAFGCHGECGDDVFQFVPIANHQAAAQYNRSISDSFYIGCTGKSHSGRLAIAGLVSATNPATFTATIRRVGWIAVSGGGGNRSLVIAIDADVAGRIDDVLVDVCYFDGSAEAGLTVQSALIQAYGTGQLGTVIIRDTQITGTPKRFGVYAAPAPGASIYLQNCTIEGEETALSVQDAGLFITNGRYATVSHGGGNTPSQAIVLGGTSPYLKVSGTPIVAGVASSKYAVSVSSASGVVDIEALRIFRASGATGVTGVFHASGSKVSLGELTGDYDSVDFGSGAIRYKDGSKLVPRSITANIDTTWIGIVNRATGTAALTFTLPQNSTLAVPVGKSFTFINGTTGAGTITFVAGTGATVVGTTVPAQNATVIVTKVDTNAWSIG